MRNDETRHATDETLRGLSPAAQRLVAAARRVLARDGFDGLTVEAVAAESGEYRDSIRYYFGSKAGLVAAVVDSLTHDQSLEAMRKTRELAPGESRIGVLVEGDRHMAEDTAAFRDFYEILPHALKDEDLRSKVAELYEWYRGLYVRGLTADEPGGSGAAPGDAGLGRDASGGRRAPAVAAPRAGVSLDDLQRFAALMTAVTDGLALQKALDPNRVELGSLFDLWDEMLRVTLSQRLEGEP